MSNSNTMNLDIEPEEIREIAYAIDYRITGELHVGYDLLPQPTDVFAELGKRIRGVYEVKHDATHELYNKPVSRATDGQVGHMAFNDFVTDALIAVMNEQATKDGTAAP